MIAENKQMRDQVFCYCFEVCLYQLAFVVYDR